MLLEDGLPVKQHFTGDLWACSKPNFGSQTGLGCCCWERIFETSSTLALSSQHVKERGMYSRLDFDSVKHQDFVQIEIKCPVSAQRAGHGVCEHKHRFACVLL